MSLLRRLLEHLNSADALAPHVDALLADDTLALSDAERQRLRAQPVEFLLGPTPSTIDSTEPAPLPRYQQVTALTDDLIALKQHMIEKIMREIDWTVDQSGFRTQSESLFNEVLQQKGMELPRRDRHRLFEAIWADIIGFGPLEPLLADESVHEILVLGPKRIYVTRNGRRERVEAVFDDAGHVQTIIDRISAPLGKAEGMKPAKSARLRDGSRVTAFESPVSLVGPSLRIFKWSRKPMTGDDLIRYGTLTPDALIVLTACVQAGLNIVISGGSSAGKTTLLDLLANRIPDYDLIVTVEDVAEMQLHQEEVLPLQSVSPRWQDVLLAEVVSHALNMRPGHLIVGEVTGAEVYDLIQTTSTWLTTINSNHPLSALDQLATYFIMGAEYQPRPFARQRIAATVDILVHIEQQRDGSRPVTRISEVRGVADDQFILSDLFLRDGQLVTANPPGTDLLHRLTSFPVEDDLRQRVQEIFAAQ